jgi:dTDP-4-dehydrorhamnose reductase
MDNPHKLTAELDRYNFNVLINCSAATNLDNFGTKFEWWLNGVLPGLLAQYSKNKKRKFVHISTASVFDGKSLFPYVECEVVNPLNEYSKSKVLGEKAVLEFGGEASFIVRTYWLYSQWKPSFVSYIQKEALNQAVRIRVVKGQWGQPTLTYDLANFILGMLGTKSLTGGIYHGTSVGQTDRIQLTNFILELMSCNSTEISEVSSKEFGEVIVRPQFPILTDTKTFSESGMFLMPPWEVSLSEFLTRHN